MQCHKQNRESGHIGLNGVLAWGGRAHRDGDSASSAVSGGARNEKGPRHLPQGLIFPGRQILLWPTEAVDIALGIAEGIETALTLARYFRPVWSLIDAGNFVDLPY
jgi:hypothetical protein